MLRIKLSVVWPNQELYIYKIPPFRLGLVPGSMRLIHGQDYGKTWQQTLGYSDAKNG